MNQNEQRPSRILNTLLWLTLVPTLLGELFKVMSWPTSGIMMIFGTYIFVFLYLPLFVVESWKQGKSKFQRIFLVVQGIILMLFACGFLFKIQHWKGSEFLYQLNYLILLCIVVPYALYRIIINRKISIYKTNNILVLIYFFSHCLSALIMTGGNKVSIDTILQQGENLENALNAVNSRNKQLYATLKTIQFDDQSDVLQRSNRLKTWTDSAMNQVKELKCKLVMLADHVSKQQADTMTSADILDKVNADVPTKIMIGNHVHPNTDKFSALSLKNLLNAFRDTVLNLVQSQNKAIIKEGLNLSTEHVILEEGEIVSWEDRNFNGMPLIYVFNTLTSIQYELKNTEYQVLTDIVNSGNQNLNTALFNQISDLNSKYDAVKKQEEIAKLQLDNEKGIELLKAKDFELDTTKQVIVYFVLAILIFLILVFFVIRSNYLRKQSNKLLVQQKEIIEIQKLEVEKQKHLVEEKQQEIIDSISYAKRLQEAILPPTEFIDKFLPEHFILYLPKDLVAGDFYWAEHIQDLFFIAAADSTGHGVPGAMVSLVCSNALNRSVKEFNLTETGKILDKTRELVLETFEKSASEVKDGMDISLLCIDRKAKKITWSGANNPLWYVDNNELKIIKADKQPIGKMEHYKPFTTHHLEYKQGLFFYLFTDGFPDQFGGPNGKKYKYKQFSELLFSLHAEKSEKQLLAIEQAFNDWKGTLEQVDDVCIIGIELKD